MDVGLWVTVASAVVAAGSAGVAFVQARHARVSADAAARQANAAERQVELAERQFDAERGPKFRVERAESFTNGERYIKTTVKMTSGPVLSSVTVTADGPEVRGLVASPGDLDVVPREVVPNVGPDGSFEVTVRVEWNATSPIRLTLDLKCAERSGQVWDQRLAVAAVDRDDPPGYLFRRSRGAGSG